MTTAAQVDDQSSKDLMTKAARKKHVPVRASVRLCPFPEHPPSLSHEGSDTAQKHAGARTSVRPSNTLICNAGWHTQEGIVPHSSRPRSLATCGKQARVWGGVRRVWGRCKARVFRAHPRPRGHRATLQLAQVSHNQREAEPDATPEAHTPGGDGAGWRPCPLFPFPPYTHTRTHARTLTRTHAHTHTHAQPCPAHADNGRHETGAVLHLP
eukprot:362546-Chlamydomonas_euryale.AAC.5